MTDPVTVQVKRLEHGEGLELPHYATSGAAGMDVLSAEDIVLEPGMRHAVATGLSVAIPPGYEIQVRPRSGLAFKYGVTVPNTPGTIDSDYRGELKVLMINHGILVAGRSLRRAADMVEIIERSAEIILGCHAVGVEPPVLPPDAAAHFRKLGDIVA